MHLMSNRFNSVPDTLIPLLNVLRPGRPLPYATKVAKYVFFLLLLLNARSLPLAWHIRVLRPAFAIRLRHLWMRLRTVFMSRQQREKEEDRWLDGLCPVGQHPLDTVVSYQSWASIDDNDFYGHLSNSSYAKTCDAARFKAALQLFPMFFRAGGWMALAATHYHFIREIPKFASYQVRTSIHAWDEKWLYVVVKFVTKSKKLTKSETSRSRSKPQAGEGSSANSIPEEGELTTTTTTTPGTPAPEFALATLSNGLNGNLTHAGITARLSEEEEEEEEEGEEENGTTVLHTIVVCQLCFKMGRITVPPAVVMAANGLTDNGPGTASAYSRENPPPSFIQAKTLMSKPCGGSTKQLREFLKGGWRHVPAEQRWWEDALGGCVEVTRKARLDAMEELRRGLEGARS